MSSTHTQSTPVIVPDSILRKVHDLIPTDAIMELLRSHYPTLTHTCEIEIGLRVCALPPPISVVSLTTELDARLADSPSFICTSLYKDTRFTKVTEVFPTMGILARRLKDNKPIHIERRCGPGTSDKLREFIEKSGIDPNAIGPAGPIEREHILDCSLEEIEDLCLAFSTTTLIAVHARRRNLRTFRELYNNRTTIEHDIDGRRPPNTTHGLQHFLNVIGLD